ncbi:MAG TPA: sigma 54-interacting transcriptional regulator [Clostridia bacterium]|jgi:arginine utilization regulatory protein|nr:sigma 54-interacting transcriptional regulator [Clostridia bacterium]
MKGVFPVDYKFLLESILKYLDEGVLVVDCNANITFFNEPATNIAGIDLEGAIGKNILEIFPDLTPETSTFYHVLRTRKPLIEHVQTYTNYQNKRVTTVTTTIPLIEKGKLIGALEIYRSLHLVKKLSDKIISLQHELFAMHRNRKDLKGNGTSYTIEDIIGNSPSMVRLKDQIYKIADSSSPVLVLGETGTGKEMVVQSIHNAGMTRRNKPFVAQNCAAIPEALLEGIVFGTSLGSFTGAKDKPGLFELANGGTLFLDEINLMDLGLQAKLLRVLQDGVVRRVGSSETIKVDVRVIAATNEDPLKSVADRTLREDLYYRLNVISLFVPPLRERKEDIPLLVDYFIKKNNQELKKNVTGVTKDCLEMLMSYDWPGNVRQLKFAIESIMNFTEAPVIGREDLPPLIRNVHAEVQNEENGELSPSFQSSLKESVELFEKNLILSALKESRGNIAEAARLLKVPKQTLHYKIQKYGIRIEFNPN